MPEVIQSTNQSPSLPVTEDVPPLTDMTSLCTVWNTQREQCQPLTTSTERKSSRWLRTHVNGAVAGSYLPHALHVGHGEDRLFVVLVRPLTGHPGGQNQALACQRATTLSQTFFRWHYTQLSYSGSIRSSPQDQSYKMQPGTLKQNSSLFIVISPVCKRSCALKKVNPSTILINHVVNSLQVWWFCIIQWKW